jgi:hypothetical protein
LPFAVHDRVGELRLEELPRLEGVERISGIENELVVGIERQLEHAVFGLGLRDDIAWFCLRSLRCEELRFALRRCVVPQGVQACRDAFVDGESVVTCDKIAILERFGIGRHQCTAQLAAWSRAKVHTVLMGRRNFEDAIYV